MQRRHMAMDMAGMDMGSSTSMMPSSTSSGMMMGSTETGMSSMHMDGMADMHMFFTTQYKEYPVLFKGLMANNAGQAFGIFLLLFTVAFLARGLEFIRLYLEEKVWKNPNYSSAFEQQPKIPHFHRADSETSHDNSIDKSDSLGVDVDVEFVESERGSYKINTLPLASRAFRNIIRLVLCILPDLFGYGLMLAAMTYTLTYFFAVVLGSGIGRFFFEKLSSKHHLRPGGFTRHC
ncbi:copper transport protein [Scheffersomyces amazonensis]|uniref:copper transport protein n=1 Tax=Scheffersomyces amazonensis TaxID=1078765 RepID=UPI00315C4E92